MRVKAAKGRTPRRDGMLAVLCRLLAVVSLVLMPFGMLGAPASAAAPHVMTASMSCDGHDTSSKSAPERKAHCTSCVAIAAPNAATPMAIFQPAIVLAGSAAHLLLGLEPDVATPPPKRA